MNSAVGAYVLSSVILLFTFKQVYCVLQALQFVQQCIAFIV